MDTVEPYEAPKIVDYGDLQDLTAACAGSSGGDAFTKAGGQGVFGVSTPAFGCKSNPQYAVEFDARLTRLGPLLVAMPGRRAEVCALPGRQSGVSEIAVADGRRVLIDPLPGKSPVAILGEPDMRARIMRALSRARLNLSQFDGVPALIEACAAREPSLVVLSVPDGGSGLAERITPLIDAVAGAPVVLVCPAIESWGVRQALIAGAAGVVELGEIERALAPTIAAVMAGQACVPSAHARQIEPPALSSREKQILGLVVMGYTNGQIAQQLFVAESTVKSHLSSAFGKLGVRSRNDAVRLIIDPDRGLGMGILALGGEPMDATGPAGP